MLIVERRGRTGARMYTRRIIQNGIIPNGISNGTKGTNKIDCLHPFYGIVRNGTG